MFLLWVTPLELALTVNGNVPSGVGPEGTLVLPPPQETRNVRTMRHRMSPILLKPPREAPSTRANTAAREYQSVEPGLCKKAAGRAVVLTARLKSRNSLPLCKSSEAGENAQLAPCGRLLQLKVTRPLKAVGPGGIAAPEITMA